MKLEMLDRRPIIVAVAGPNGAGKSTFFERYIRPGQLQFVNADVLALANGFGAYEAAEMAGELRRELLKRGESFVFETVLSDPVGEKVNFLLGTAEKGHTVVLCYIGLDSAEESDARVALRVTQGGHDVPTDKLVARYPRTLENLRRALKTLPCVLVYDNSDLSEPFRFIAEYRGGSPTRATNNLPGWFRQVMERLDT